MNSSTIERLFLLLLILCGILQGCKTGQNPSVATIPFPKESTTPGEPGRETSLESLKAAPTRYFDLLHTRLEATIDWEHQRLLGTATLQLTPYFYPQDRLALDAKSMEFVSVELMVATTDSGVPLDFKYDEKVLQVNFGESYHRYDTILVNIKYKTGAFSEGQNQWLQKGIYFIDPLQMDSLKPTQMWTHGEPEETSYWIPTIDAPNERATHEIFITVEDQFKTLSNGILQESRWNSSGLRTDHWVMNQPHAPYLFMLAVGDFAVVSDVFETIPLEYWVEPEYAPYAQSIFGNTPEMMAFFSELLQYPFPWEKYTQIVVRDFVSGAMENTTASVFMEDLQVDRRSLLDFRWDYIIAHELMHHWFGNLVTCKSWSHLPLNEGFADYAEYLWNAHKYGQEEADYHFMNDLALYLEESEEKQVPLIRYDYLDPDEMFDAHSYQKSARVIHMLRSYVGDEAFFEALRQYLKIYAYQSVELDQLRMVFEEVTGEDLRWFFEQWFFVPGHPVLQVSHEYLQDTVYVKIAQMQDFDASTIYQLPFYIDIFIGEETIRYPVNMNSPYEEHRIHSETAPSLVLVDGDCQLLAEINHQKSKKEYIHQYRYAERYPAKIEALEALASSEIDERSVQIFREALGDSYFRMREFAIEFFTENIQLADGDVSAQIQNQLADTISDVRAAVLSFLGEKSYTSYKKEIQSALGDSAYSVVGTALALIRENEPGFFEQVVSDFTDYQDINVILPIADYYVGKKQKHTWFLQKAVRMRTSDLYYFLPYLNNYLLLAPEAEKRHFIPYLEMLGKHHDNYMIRFLAIQGLLFSPEVKEVADILKSIISSERDPRLVEILNSITVE